MDNSDHIPPAEPLVKPLHIVETKDANGCNNICLQCNCGWRAYASRDGRSDLRAAESARFLILEHQVHALMGIADKTNESLLTAIRNVSNRWYAWSFPPLPEDGERYKIWVEFEKRLNERRNDPDGDDL